MRLVRYVVAMSIVVGLAGELSAFGQYQSKRKPRESFVCAAGSDVVKVNSYFSLPPGGGLTGYCITDLSLLDRKCAGEAGDGYWCDTLDRYCATLAKLDKDEDDAARARMQAAQSMAPYYQSQAQAYGYLQGMGAGSFDTSVADQGFNNMLDNIMGAYGDGILALNPQAKPSSCSAREPGGRLRPSPPAAPPPALPDPSKPRAKKKAIKASTPRFGLD